MIASTLPPVFSSSTSRRDPVGRSEPVSRPDDPSERDPRDEKRVVRARPEFSLLLALLAGASPAARAEALRDLPEGSASLLDRLLGDAGAVGSAANKTEEPTAGASAEASQRSSSASDLLRYGLMQQASRSRSEADALNGLLVGADDVDGLSGADGVMSSFSARRGSASDARALSLLAGRRGARQAELLALGDDRGAGLLAAIDALLARAGTTEGAAIADADAASRAAARAAADAAALADANAISAADVTTPVRDPDALATELRLKLDRVIARMRDEYGSDVTIVETARSQERQDFLYAQGRTRPGPIVTWTQDSAHTRGEAVDVLVDGSWNNADGYARLQRIAREEGLRTLGLKDPGHLELMRDGKQTDIAANAVARIEQRAAATALKYTISGTSSVARIASVASVASVARVAGRGPYTETLASPTSPAESTAQPGAVDARARSGGLMSDGGDASGAGQRRGDTKTRQLDGRIDTSGAERAVTMASVAVAPTQTAPTEVAASVGVSSAERVADIQQLRADAPSGALSRMTLDVEGPNGPQRITVDLRGNTVDTQITTDAASAERLRSHTAELQDALGRRGLTSESVRITGTSKPEQLVSRMGVGEHDVVGVAPGSNQAGPDSQAMGQGPRDRGMTREWEKNEDARKARDEQRQNAGQRGQRSPFNPDAR